MLNNKDKVQGLVSTFFSTEVIRSQLLENTGAERVIRGMIRGRACLRMQEALVSPCIHFSLTQSHVLQVLGPK